MTHSIGRIVQYKLTEQDALAINRRRADTQAHLDEHRANANGVQVHVGNKASAGDIFPMLITRVWGDTPESSVNGQVFLDGNDSLWVTSVACFYGHDGTEWPERQFRYPSLV